MLAAAGASWGDSAGEAIATPDWTQGKHAQPPTATQQAHQRFNRRMTTLHAHNGLESALVMTSILGDTPSFSEVADVYRFESTIAIKLQ